MKWQLSICSMALAAGSLLVPAGFGQATARGKRITVFGGPTSYLGVGVADVDAERAKALNLKEERGAEIKRVDEDSPAAKAGLKEGDVVLEYNGQRVEGMQQFVRMVQETPPDRQVKLGIWRNGTSQTVTATLGSTSARRYDGGFRFEIPPIPPIAVAPPDVPSGYMSWRTGLLGIETERLNSQLAEFFGVKEGVLVRSVNKGSPAEKAGIKAGDVITKVDNEKVTSPGELSSHLRSARSKKTFPITVVRERKETTLSVTLEENGPRRRTGNALLFPYIDNAWSIFDEAPNPDFFDLPSDVDFLTTPPASIL